MWTINANHARITATVVIAKWVSVLYICTAQKKKKKKEDML
jgi:hypothetical protein